jgi:hypothetical protein
MDQRYTNFILLLGAYVVVVLVTGLGNWYLRTGRVGDQGRQGGKLANNQVKNLNPVSQ